MKYTFEEIREKGLLLFEYIRGSKSQGLDIETSDIRCGNTSYDEIMSYVQDKKAELNDAIKDCTLPDKVDKDSVNKILVELRKELYIKGV